VLVIDACCLELFLVFALFNSRKWLDIILRSGCKRKKKHTSRKFPGRCP
jgi:hypothetical protein